MAKRALCVGINDYPYGDDSDLNGCVNDAKAWADLLLTHFGFTDVRLLVDAAATKATIAAGVKELIGTAQAGDILVYTFSGHGTYVTDTDNDEALYDEAQCPYDVADDLLIDDDWRKIFANIPEDVQLTVISDSCFSGTATRAPLAPPGKKTPDDRRVRFLNPARFGGTVLSNPWKNQEKVTAAKKETHPESSMKEIFLSGCSDSEYSYDALINGIYHGAMTYHAIQAIVAANFDLTYADMHKKLLGLVKDAGYPQTPQLEGKDDNKQRKLFT